MSRNKYARRLKPFLKKPFFTLEEAENEGIPRQAIVYLAKSGTLEHLYPGVYKSADYEPKVEFAWENLALIAASVPGAVICLISALCYHNLTDQIMREAWIAIPHTQRAPKRPNARVVRTRNIHLGKEKIRIGEYSIYIFNRERTIVDAFRYLSKEIAIKALKHYFTDNEKKPNLKLLTEYAKTLRVNIDPYILSYTL